MCLNHSKYKQNLTFQGSEEGRESRPLPERVFLTFLAPFGRPWGLSLASFGYFFHVIFSSDFWMNSGVARGGVGYRGMGQYNDSKRQLELLVLPSDLKRIRRQPPTPLEGAAGSTTPSATTGRAH